MNELDLYDVSKEYVAYLQSAEIEKRGFTRVPNMVYPDREQKFLCGTVLNIGEINYYVAATSYNKQQSENILIIFKNDKSPIKGSLRFNFMFPIPKEMVTRRIIDNEKNPQRKAFLSRQLEFFKTNADGIYHKAQQTYKKIINQYSPSLVQNSCDFKLLESKCIEFCKMNNLYIPSLPEKRLVKKHCNNNKNDILNELGKKIDDGNVELISQFNELQYQLNKDHQKQIIVGKEKELELIK